MDGAADDNANFGQSDTSMRNHSKSITFSMGREIDEVMKRLQDLFKIFVSFVSTLSFL